MNIRYITELNNIMSEIIYFTRIHYMLHGNKINAEDIIKDMQPSLNELSEETIIRLINEEIDVIKCYNIKERHKYGIFIGRFQPFHFGHQHTINEILLDGLKPLMVIGSINENRDRRKNPLSFEDRTKLIRMIYSEDVVSIVGKEDNTDWDGWFDDLIKTILNHLNCNANDITFYINNKEIDRIEKFTCKGKHYTNDFYTSVFSDNGFKVKQIEFVDRKDFNIDANARDIRTDIDGFKHFLDARVYWELKNKGW